MSHGSSHHRSEYIMVLPSQGVDTEAWRGHPASQGHRHSQGRACMEFSRDSLAAPGSVICSMILTTPTPTPAPNYTAVRMPRRAPAPQSLPPTEISPAKHLARPLQRSHTERELPCPFFPPGSQGGSLLPTVLCAPPPPAKRVHRPLEGGPFGSRCLGSERVWQGAW